VNQEPEVVKNLETSTTGPGGSDYSAFIREGIEALALMTAGGIGHPDYHDAGDDPEKIDTEMLRRNGQFELQGIINVANETTTNLLIADRLHLYNGMRLMPLNLAEVRTGGGMFMIGPGGISQQAAPGPRFSLSVDLAALNGNLGLIDAAANLMNVGRVEVNTPDGTWFTAAGVTDKGKAALKAFEAAGIVLQFNNPSAALLADVLDNAKKGVVVTGMTAVPDADLAKKMADRNAVLSVEFDAAAPDAVADQLIALKKAFGGSGNLLLTTQERTVRSPMGDSAQTPHQKLVDGAKQQLYLKLVKAGWTKDEIYSMAGVSPQPAGMPMMMPGGPGRLGGNLGKLSS
jgi:hypothetical protein